MDLNVNWSNKNIKDIKSSSDLFQSFRFFFALASLELYKYGTYKSIVSVFKCRL